MVRRPSPGAIGARLLTALVALVALSLAGCARAGQAPVGGEAASGFAASAGTRLVVFPDDGLDPLLQLIDGAARTLDVYVFDLGSEAIEHRLTDAAKRGVRVRAIVEPNPTGRLAAARDTMTRLRRAGVAVKPAGRPFSKTHAKALAVDGARAWIGTANFVDDWAVRRDYAVIVANANTVAALARTFEQDWLGAATALRLPLPGGSVDPRSHLVISPNNGRSEVAALISGARFSLYLQQDQIDDPATMDLIARRSAAGVDVRVVMSDDQAARKAAAALRARSPEIRVRLLRGPEVHAKLAIADEARALLGSQNLTRQSLDTRREVGVLLDDPQVVGSLVGVFDRDFDQEEDETIALPRVTRGGTAPFLWGFVAGGLAVCAGAVVWSTGGRLR
ncbi:MAG TPA: phospholipase D-like domain-containing protein [Chloroflexota bacterium]|nr:phospholipase D-like domain-containing protein [Chloroflexota bacterium]